ncbi:MAG TPA: DUF5615 family PIN-like protein [Candidatus Angelobacter sp.]|jgi:predicted nuclease of predicted toxin-antitoxin system|nr:DUF5615 family PIN-like protein [Candidatus Angelobacter sp.]
MKVLIDECLHTSLVELAHAAGHAADHVNYLALGGYKDWQLMAVIREQEYTISMDGYKRQICIRNGAHFQLAIKPRPLPSNQLARAFSTNTQHITRESHLLVLSPRRIK